MRQRERFSKLIDLQYPHTFGCQSFDHNVTEELVRLRKSILDHAFDGLLPEMLRKQAFVELYLQMLSERFTQSGCDGLISQLHRIAEEDNGAVIFGDVANLKIANNVSREKGDWMLYVIAMAIHESSADLYGRFREGDEFVAYSSDVQQAHALCEEILEKIAKERIQGLPLRVDFGVVSHAEVASTFLKLIEGGWQIPEGQTAEQVFFDIAIEIAEVRSSVVKIYERTLLLTALLRSCARSMHLRKMLNWFEIWTQYRKHVDLLTRGGKFVFPNLFWLRLGRQELETKALEETLKLLEVGRANGLCSTVVLETAYSIYRDPQG